MLGICLDAAQQLSCVLHRTVSPPHIGRTPCEELEGYAKCYDWFQCFAFKWNCLFFKFFLLRLTTVFKSGDSVQAITHSEAAFKGQRCFFFFFFDIYKSFYLSTWTCLCVCVRPSVVCVMSLQVFMKILNSLFFLLLEKAPCGFWKQLCCFSLPVWFKSSGQRSAKGPCVAVFFLHLCVLPSVEIICYLMSLSD